ncbi:MAG: chromosome partitioning protein ParB [Marinilabiliales bacterium]|nr:MAG: chromosome partitioning protein ParB [Marinilabiliales bacterium]
MAKQKKALGRGLGALLNDADTDLVQSGKGAGVAFPLIDIDEIEANPYQPRSVFEEETLNELAASIKRQGLIQPITVRKIADHKYQLISGERRLRASKMAGLTEIPAYVREADDNAMVEMALVENIQRENLNSIEIALTFQKLMEEFNLTQEELSEKVGKKRTTVANYLRLLKLPIEVQAGIRDEKISMGHARALITLKNKDILLGIFDKIIDSGLNVRQVEELVRKSARSGKQEKAPDKVSPSGLEKVGTKISKSLKMKVSVKKGRGNGGSIAIHFKDEKELKEIEKRLS